MVTEYTGEVFVRRTLVNASSNYAAKLFSLGAWLFLTRFTLQYLGPHLYGLWVLVGSLTAYGSLFDFGVAAAIIKYVAEFRAKQEPDRARSLIATALWLYLGLGLAVVLLAALLAPVFPHLFSIGPNQRATAMWLVLLSGAHVGISILCSAPAAVLQGLQRFDILNLLSVVGTLASAVITVGVLSAGGGVLGLASAGIVMTLLMQIPAIWFIRRLAPEMPIGWRGADKRLAKTVAAFSSSLFVMHLGGQLESKTDEIVIGRLMPLTAITPYNIARRLSALPLALTEQFLSLLLPLASALDAENDQGRVRSLYIISTRITLAIFMPVGLSLIVLAKPILAMWVGEEYRAYSYLVVILTLASLIDTSQWPAGIILQGMARHKPLALLTLASGIGNLGLSIILIAFLGLAGVALGTLIPTAIVCLLGVMPYALRVMDVSLREFVTRAFLPSLLPAIPALGAAFILESMWASPTMVSLGLVAGGTSIVFAAGYLALKDNEFERRTILWIAATLVASVRLQWQRVWR